jgi:Ca2+-binding RTX toxin-like protein
VSAQLTLTLCSATAFENIIGGDQADTLTGNTLANRLEGRGGDDSLSGAGGNDTYVFDADAPLGGDVLSDSAGVDLLELTNTSTQSVVLNLGLAGAQVVNPHLTLTLGSATAFENISGGALADTLTGNTLANRFEGRGGDDSLSGAGGNDTYVFDADAPLGSDVLSDSAGVDLLDFSLTTTKSIALNLNLTGAQVVNSQLTLTLGTSTYENVNGGGLADALTGNAANNVLVGNAGSDVLLGNAGNDTLTGGAGGDQLVGGDDNDTYVFAAATAAEVDVVVELSAGGVDTLSFSGLAATNPVTVDLQLDAGLAAHTNRTINTGAAGQAAEFEHATGGQGPDVLRGNAANNSLLGGNGNDTLEGRGGHDTLEGGAGSDVLMGNDGDDAYVFKAATAAEVDTVFELLNEGFDTLNFGALAASAAVTVNLTLAAGTAVHANRTVNMGVAGQEANLESAVGGSGADTLIGNAADNLLIGNAGNDTFDGGLGSDTADGGTGTDSQTNCETLLNIP